MLLREEEEVVGVRLSTFPRLSATGILSRDFISSLIKGIKCLWMDWYRETVWYKVNVAITTPKLIFFNIAFSVLLLLYDRSLQTIFYLFLKYICGKNKCSGGYIKQRVCGSKKLHNNLFYGLSQADKCNITVLLLATTALSELLFCNVNQHLLPNWKQEFSRCLV